jgi:hypothetical protein
MACLPSADEDLFGLARKELYTAVVGDIMDLLGYKRQFLPPQIQPLRDDMVVIGCAMPPREIDVGVFAQALDKARGERLVFDAIKGGMLAQEAWDRFGVM